MDKGGIMKKINIIVPVFKNLENIKMKMNHISKYFKKEDTINIIFIGNSSFLNNFNEKKYNYTNINVKSMDYKLKEPNELIKIAFENIEVLDTFIVDFSNPEFYNLFKNLYKHSDTSYITLIKPKNKNPFKLVLDFVYDLGAKFLGLKKDNKSMNLFQFFTSKNVEYIKNNPKYNAYLRNFDVWGYNYVNFIKLDANFYDRNNDLKYINFFDKSTIFSNMLIFSSLPSIFLTIIFGNNFPNSISFLSTLLVFFVMLSIGSYTLINKILRFRLNKIN